MSKLRTRLLLVTALVGAALVAAVSVSGNDSGTVTANPATVEAVMPAPATEAPPSPSAGPLSSNGTWLVPSQIEPGTYRAEARVGPLGGVAYYEICATLGCDPFGTGTIIGNGIVDGPAYVVIPDDAVSVNLTDLTLTPVEG